MGFGKHFSTYFWELYFIFIIVIVIIIIITIIVIVIIISTIVIIIIIGWRELVPERRFYKKHDPTIPLVEQNEHDSFPLSASLDVLR